jgi:hypothetical protein
MTLTGRKKHVSVLEQAGLIATATVGLDRRHVRATGRAPRQPRRESMNVSISGFGEFRDRFGAGRHFG